jgi:major intracellular serine protease
MSFYLPKYTVQEMSPAALKTIMSATTRVCPKGICSSAFKRAWDEGFSGKGIVVAIVDTGIDAKHPDLAGKIVKSFNLTGEPLDEDHGTHVAGTIVANGWLLGGAPDCQIIDIKVLGKKGGSVDDIAKGIRMAVENGAHVINMSLGGSGFNRADISKLSAAIQTAWDQGVLCICASGNDGNSVGTRDVYEYPAAIDQVESIAACDVGDDLNTITLASFSNENDKVDLGACGSCVLSTIRGGKYACLDGTSMATPHISAMTALLAQKLRKQQPDLKGKKFSAELEKLLFSNVVPVKPEAPGPVNISFGRGFLRYQPEKGPVIPSGKKVFQGKLFIGYSL